MSDHRSSSRFAVVRKLRAFEKSAMSWTIENPRPYRAIVTVVFVLSLLVQVRQFSDADNLWGVRILSVVIVVMFIGVYTVLVVTWRRQDLLDELRRLVTEHTDDRHLGNIAWLWAYRVAPTRDVREVVTWLETHNIARTQPDDMPQPVRVLTSVLGASL